MTVAREKAEAARRASRVLARASGEARAAAVRAIGDALVAHEDAILAANARDIEAAHGLPKSLVDRLKLDAQKLAALATMVREVAALPDPVGEVRRETLLDDGLLLRQVAVPLGVVLCVFESRPDAVAQIAALAVRSGNAALLKGGAEAARSCAAIHAALSEALAKSGLPEESVQLVDSRAEVSELLALDTLIDLVVPRGSSALVTSVQERTRIPVLGHAEGVCHVYVDGAADLDKALAIALDAKVDYPAACNAAEAVLIDQRVAKAFAPRLKAAFAAKGVTVYEDTAHYGQEFGDLRVVLAVVDGVQGAIGFVNRFGSRHTDAIVTEDAAAARAFIDGVDAAGVFVNASTRFADGYRYGLGAELGVSTSKVHARGPVGLEGLVTTKWILEGSGQTVGEYSSGAKKFKHEHRRTESEARREATAERRAGDERPPADERSASARSESARERRK
ncbi:MAG: glutamate-5-semialdehyde dehydrogenase [Thermoplasmatota archaeon]